MSARSRIFLVSGDVLALAVVTVIGFAAHQELATAFIPRLLTTFLPLLAGWFLVSPWLGLFEQNIVRDPRQLWRPILAMLLGAPVAGVLRGALLGTAVQPVFVLVLGGSSGVLLLLWRLVYFFLIRKHG